MKNPRHLTIDEKRDWLAAVFRDSCGEFSPAEKFKAMIEDTKLAALQQESDSPPGGELPLLADLLQNLPPPRSEDPSR